MIRRAAAIVFALAVNPALLYARRMLCWRRATVPSAEVYQAPSNVTPVIGHLPRGTMLPIARNLGSWVKIAWPDGRDGFGYVHVTMGRIGPVTGDEWPTTASGPRSAKRAIVPITQTPSKAAWRSSPRLPASSPPAARVQGNASPASHMFGVGGLGGYTRSIGATARVWKRQPHRHSVRHHAEYIDERCLCRSIDDNAVRTGDHLRTVSTESPMTCGCGLTSDRRWRSVTCPQANCSRFQTTQPVSASLAAPNSCSLVERAAVRYQRGPRLPRRFQEPIAGFDDKRMTVAIAGHWYIR